MYMLHRPNAKKKTNKLVNEKNNNTGFRNKNARYTS